MATQRKTNTRHVTHNNFNHRLSVPVEIAFTFKRDNWSLEPSSGFRFQYAQQFNGRLLREGNYEIVLKEINDTYYSNNVSMGLITSLNLKYNISQKGAIGLKFKYEMDDFLNLNKTKFSYKYETFGFLLGYYQAI